MKMYTGDWSEENPGLVVAVGIGAGLLFALVAYLALIRTGYVSRYAEKEEKPTTNEEAEASPEDNVELKKLGSTSDAEADGNDVDIESNIKAKTDPGDGDNTNAFDKETLNATKKWLTSGLDKDVFEDMSKEEKDLEKYSVKFDVRTEKLFEWLQVLAAIFGIFAHGSNDIANAIAPFTSIYQLSKLKRNYEGEISSKNDVPWGILFLGAIFMSIGCVTYGYNVIKTLGLKLAKMSPTRGYFTQVASALVIIFASNYGFPASTTHCQVGATIAIGLVEKYYADKKLKWNQIFNWKLLLQVFFGWIATLLIAGTTSALIFSVLAFSPCI